MSIQELKESIQELKDAIAVSSAEDIAVLQPILDEAEEQLQVAEKKEAKPKRPSAVDRIHDELEVESPQMADAEKADFAKRMKKARDAKAAADIQKRWTARKEQKKSETQKPTPSVLGLKLKKSSGGEEFELIVHDIEFDKDGHGKGDFSIEKSTDEIGLLLTGNINSDTDAVVEFLKDTENWLPQAAKVLEKELQNCSEFTFDEHPTWDYTIYSDRIQIRTFFECIDKAKNNASKKPTPSVKKPKSGKIDNIDKNTKIGKITKREIDELQRVHIGCDQYAMLNDTDEVWTVDTVVGTLTCKPNEVVLFLKTGDPFTVMQQKTFKGRCIKVGDEDKVTVEVETPIGNKEVARVNEATGEVETAPKNRKKRVSKHIEDKVEKLAKKMVGDNCDVVQFLKDVEGSPLDDAVWGKVAEWNKKLTQEKIDRIGIDDEGHLIAQMADYSGVFGDLIKDKSYYKICAEHGTWELLPKSQWSTLEASFQKRKFKSQYGLAEMKRYYNYGDPKSKKYDAKLMECKTLGKEAYALRSKDSAQASELYKKHYATCRNQVLNEYNRVYLQGLHGLAAEHKAENAGVSYRDALKHIRVELHEKALKQAA